MAKNKNLGLGRGLEAIFLDNELISEKSSDGISVLRLSQIEPRPNQPRKSFDNEALAQLADSITNHGLIQPIVVRASDSGFYRIIAGERRWRAAKMAGLSEVPVIIMDIDDKKASEVALIENIQREDLNAIEEAEAYKALISEYNLTQEEVSKSIGKSRSAIANSLRLLELPPEVTDMIAADKLTAGHARALLGIDDTSRITEAAELVFKHNMSVRDTEELVRSMNRVRENDENEDSEEAQAEVNYCAELERKLTKAMGRRIKISVGKRSKRLEIEYADNDDLNNIIEKLFGEYILEE